MVNGAPEVVSYTTTELELPVTNSYTTKNGGHYTTSTIEVPVTA